MATGASSSGSDAKDVAGGRLGGARADFVASLGRKVADARDILAAIEAEPSSIAARSEMRRRMHALGTGARLLHFGSMAGAIQEAITVLDRGANAGEIGRDDVGFLAQLLDDLPALVWGDAPSADASGSVADERVDSLAQLPVSVLVIGDEALADLLMDGAGSHSMECERTDDVVQARQLARAYAPDLVLMDGDQPRAAELVASLLEDPLTEPVPIVVVGSFASPEDEARFVGLGVARSIARPASGDVIRRVCDEVLGAREERTMRVTLGEPTLEQLAERLAQELKSALVDGVDPGARSSRVPLGEGTEVLGALWGAIARVQEIVQQKTGGAVRFAGGAPEGAIALAPWLHHDLAAADRAAGRGRGAGADVRLQGRRVVVADDDPGVTWFLSDLLRTAGCEVHEALDGSTARELAFRVQPELVVSDILMPGLDGFALCRALKRDVALRDTPVILLSWKEDLLQRVRELGASAAAYMRKESDSRAVLARVREVLRPRARIEARLRAEGEVRGRLDGLTPRLLLDLVCTIRKDARVAVRDATCLYEIEIRGGAPRRATRTASDGGHQGGEAALARMLGIGAGRFVVSASRDPVRSEMSGSLYELLARPLAAARGALAATTGAKVMDVDRILLDATVLDEYLAATPDPARTLLRQLAQGASPRQMLVDGAVAPALMEDVLGDLAARCAIRAVVAEDGTDLLTPAVEAALATLMSAAPAPPPRVAGARPSTAPPPSPARLEPARPEPKAPASVHPEPRPLFPEGALVLSEPPPPPPPRARSLAPPPSAAPDDESGPPSSLEDAVMRELSDRSPVPGATHPSSPNLPPIIEPSALRPRSSNPPANEVPAVVEAEERALPSIPPDAVVPAATSVDEYAAAPAASMLPGSPSIPPLEEAADPFASPPPPVDPTPIAPPPEMDEASAKVDVAAPADEPSARLDEAVVPSTLSRPPAPAPSLPPPTASPASLPPTKVAEPPPSPEPEPPRGPDPLWFVLAFAVLGGAVGAALRVSSTERPVAARQRAPEPVAVVSAPSATPAPPPPAPVPTAAADDMPPGLDVPAGYGVLDLVLPQGAAAQVDGRVIAPPSAIPAGHHKVHVEVNGRVQEFETDIQAGRTTHVRPPTAP
jgi:DNA-binding response OmpR family regulator